MKIIPLTQDLVAYVDDEDFERLNRYKWRALRGRNTWYAVYGKKNNFMHHLVIGKPLKGLVTDHIDENGLHNWEDNLRFVTQRVNLQHTNRTKSSIYPGVSWNKSRHKWLASIRVNGLEKFLGRFENEKEAYEAYQKVFEEIENPVLPSYNSEEVLRKTIREIKKGGNYEEIKRVASPLKR